EPGNAYEKLAEFYRSKKDTMSELKVLQDYIKVNANSEASYERLAEMSQSAGDWNKTLEYSKRLLGINPLSAFGYKNLAIANMKTGNESEAKKYFEKALKCKEKLYNSEIHYHLALLLKDKDNKMAKRHVLMSLEEAPRFRDAYKLLLELK
ncbi:MAG: hypothetical protein NE327_21460, partial [Lentisphaeraceae bacterium]|nr:hypothetical protein [Lentisphaeraceae bacterium]